MVLGSFRKRFSNIVRYSNSLNSFEGCNRFSLLRCAPLAIITVYAIYSRAQKLCNLKQSIDLNKRNAALRFAIYSLLFTTLCVCLTCPSAQNFTQAFLQSVLYTIVEVLNTNLRRSSLLTYFNGFQMYVA